MAKLPFMQLFTGDWLKDPLLSLCAPATRGIWIDLICAMHECDRSGEIHGTREQLARVARCSPAEIDAALNDLRDSGAADVKSCDANVTACNANVTLRNDVVTVINRRMQREHKSRNNSMLRVRKHRSNSSCNAGITPHISEFIYQNTYSSSKNDSIPAHAPPSNSIPSEDESAAADLLIRSEPTMDREFAIRALSGTGSQADAVARRALADLRSYAEHNQISHRGRWLYEAITKGKASWMEQSQSKRQRKTSVSRKSDVDDHARLAPAIARWRGITQDRRAELAREAAELVYPAQAGDTPAKAAYVESQAKADVPSRIILLRVLEMIDGRELNRDIPNTNRTPFMTGT